MSNKIGKEFLLFLLPYQNSLLLTSLYIKMNFLKEKNQQMNEFKETHKSFYFLQLLFWGVFVIALKIKHCIKIWFRSHFQGSPHIIKSNIYL